MEGAAESIAAREVGMDRTMLKLFNEALKADRYADASHPTIIVVYRPPLHDTTMVHDAS